MSKRLLSEEEKILHHGEQDSRDTKRQQKSDIRLSTENGSSHGCLAAFLALSSQADNLIDCLQLIKERSGRINSDGDVSIVQDLVDRLSEIVPTIVPQLQYLSNRIPNEGAPAHDSGRNSYRAKFESTIQNARVTGTVSVDAWTSSDIPDALPPLPPVLDESLEEAAFTHPGRSQWQHYERLEWLGDAYLELLASILISQTFPTLSSGRCSQMRERLIRNTTLADYFRQYGLHSRAKLPNDLGRAVGRGRSNDKDIIKTQADMFEAYTAAAIISDPTNGLSTVIQWLRRLWATTIKEDLQSLKKEQTSSITTSATGADAVPATVAPDDGPKKLCPKEELAALIVVKGVWLRYETLKCNKKDKNSGLPLHAVGAYFDGWGETHKLLGTGTALSVKEAGQKAATDALQNKKLMKFFGGKKREYKEVMNKTAVVAGEE